MKPRTLPDDATSAIAADVARVKRWTALAVRRRDELQPALEAAVAAVPSHDLPTTREARDLVLEAMDGVLRDPVLVLRRLLARRYARRALKALDARALELGLAQRPDASGLPVTLERARLGAEGKWVEAAGRHDHGAVVVQIPGGLPCPWCGGGGVEVDGMHVIVCERDAAHVFAWVPWGG